MSKLCEESELWNIRRLEDVIRVNRRIDRSTVPKIEKVTLVTCGEVSDLGSQVTRRAIVGPLAGILTASYQEPPSPPRLPTNV